MLVELQYGIGINPTALSGGGGGGQLCHTELPTFALHGLIVYSDHIQYVRHSRSSIGSDCLRL